MSRSESFEEPSDSFSSYYRGYVDVEQRTPGTYRKRDLDALKARQSAAAKEGDGRVNPGFEQEEPVIFARRNPPAYELELIGSHLFVKISLCPFCRELRVCLIRTDGCAVVSSNTCVLVHISNLYLGH